MLKMKNLELCFDAAAKESANYVGVLVQINNNESKELIVNKRPSFEEKLAYYKNAYDNDLNHKHAVGIKIVGFCQADSLGELEQLF